VFVLNFASLLSIFFSGDLRDEADSHFVNRSAWQNEIDEWVDNMKRIERNLESWEQHLRDREWWVEEQEKKLQQQFKVVVRGCEICISDGCWLVLFGQLVVRCSSFKVLNDSV
jgi:DNA repair exonuclease SbcCD ATPase subunit